MIYTFSFKKSENKKIHNNQKKVINITAEINKIKNKLKNKKLIKPKRGLK